MGDHHPAGIDLTRTLRTQRAPHGVPFSHPGTKKSTGCIHRAFMRESLFWSNAGTLTEGNGGWITPH